MIVDSELFEDAGDTDNGCVGSASEITIAKEKAKNVSGRSY